MVEYPKEQDEVETLPQPGDVVDRELAKLDLGLGKSGRELRLLQVVGVGVDRDYALRTSTLHLDRVEAGVAADVEHAQPAQVIGQCVREALPFDVGVVAQEMFGCGPDAAQLHVVEPGAELDDAAGELVGAVHRPASVATRHRSVARSSAAVKTCVSESPRACTSS